MKINDEFMYPPEPFFRKMQFRIYAVDDKTVSALDINENIGNRLAGPVHYYWLNKTALEYAKWLILDGKPVTEA